MRRIAIFFLGILFSSTASAWWSVPWSAKEMCKYIPQSYSTSQIHMFFDAQDKDPFHITYRKTLFFTFPIVSQSNGEIVLLDKLGDLFHGRPHGSTFVIGDYDIFYREAITSKGRVLTKIFSFPRKMPSFARKPLWTIYKLCRSENCEGELAKGEWEKVGDDIDQIPMQLGDVFAFFYSRVSVRMPPKLECVTEPVHLPMGPFQ